METLIINGSPRKNGDSISLIKEFKKYMVGEIHTVNTYFDNINPCTDCRYCWENNSCRIDDRMLEIYMLLNKVDNVLLVSPLYFSQLTGSLLNFASRLQYFYVSRCIRKDKSFSLKKKNGILILTGGGDGSPNMAISMAKILFHQMNAEMIECICSLQTGILPSSEDEIALNKVREIIKKLSGDNT